jgi:hypothetical protein
VRRIAWRLQANAKGDLSERARQRAFDVTLPEEGDVYTIRSYLALVTPRRGKAAAAADDPNSFHIVFSANTERMASLGWGMGETRGARLPGLDAFAG